MGITEAFKKYGATLKNTFWSVSAENKEGELVVSLWKHFFEKTNGGHIRYVDKVSRWSGNGNVEFRERVAKAYDTGQKVRTVIARTDDEEAVRNGVDASTLKNTFYVKETWEGVVTLWDGDNFEIEFTDKAYRA